MGLCVSLCLCGYRSVHEWMTQPGSMVAGYEKSRLRKQYPCSLRKTNLAHRIKTMFPLCWDQSPMTPPMFLLLTRHTCMSLVHP